MRLPPRHALPAVPFGTSLRSVLCLLAAGGCATPLRPSGGPEDRTPPQLEASLPAAGAVNVRTDRLVLTFSERLDEASAQRALTVAPAFDRPPAVRARGHTLEVVFPDSLRPEATYVVTLGTELRDLHGAALAAPLTVAFATGPRIDAGRIAGLIRDPASDAPAAGLAVLAYHLADTTAAARPDPRTAAPDYRTQSGTDGAFTLSYLREGPYFVVVLDDRDRDGRADPAERFAAPPVPVLHARPAPAAPTPGAPTPGAPTPGDPTPDSAAGAAGPDSLRPPPAAPPPPTERPPTEPPAAFYVARLDTTAPALRAVRALTSRRVAARFDEAVVLAGDAAWTLADSATGRAVPVEAAFVRPDEPREVVVVAGAPTPPGRYRLRLATPGSVRDSTGNPAAGPEVAGSFAASATPDTARARFAGFLPEATGTADSVRALRPGDDPGRRAGVRFTLPLDSAAVRARLAVRDAQGAAVPFALAPDGGLAYRLRLPPALRAFTVAVREDDSTRTARFSVLGPDELGALVGQLPGAGAGRVVEAFPVTAARGARYVARADATGAFALRDLPPGEYRLRVFADRNGNGRWDGGALAPYVPPEPLRWLGAPVRARARWETEVESGNLGIGEAGN